MDVEAVEFTTDKGQFRFSFDPPVLAKNDGCVVRAVGPKPLQVLSALIQETRRGQSRGTKRVVVRKTDILDKAWSMEEKAGIEALDVHISKLRKILGKTSIETHHGMGLSFAPKIRHARSAAEADPEPPLPSESDSAARSHTPRKTKSPQGDRQDRIPLEVGEPPKAPHVTQEQRIHWRAVLNALDRFRNWLTPKRRVHVVLYLMMPLITAWVVADVVAVPYAATASVGLLWSIGMGLSARMFTASARHPALTFILVQCTAFLPLALGADWWLVMAGKAGGHFVIAVERPAGGEPQDREAILDALQKVSANNPSVRIVPLRMQTEPEIPSADALPHDADVLIRQYIAGRQTRILVTWLKASCPWCQAPATERHTIPLAGREAFEFADELGIATADTAKLMAAFGLTFSTRPDVAAGIQLFTDLIASRDARKDDRGLSELIYMRSGAYLRAGQESRAAADIQRAIELRPGDCGILITAAMINKVEAARGQALIDETLKACAQDRPSFAALDRGVQGQLLASLSLLLQSHLRYQQAKEVALKAYELAPTSQMVINNLGVTYNSLGQYDLAEARFEDAVRLEPRDPYARNNRASQMYRKGHWVRALIDFSIALQMFPEYESAILNRERLLLDIAVWSSGSLATRWATPALVRVTAYYADRIPETSERLSAERAYFKASCYLGMAKYKEAIFWAEKAASGPVGADRPIAYLVQARAHQSLGHKHEYVCALRQSVKVQGMFNFLSATALVGQTVPGSVLQMIGGPNTRPLENEISAAEKQIGRQDCPEEMGTRSVF